MTIAAKHEESSPAVRELLEGRTLAYGIGAQRSGTSWLSNLLYSHNSVSVPHFKEVHYWNYYETGNESTFPQERASRFQARFGQLGSSILRRISGRFRIAETEQEAWLGLFKSKTGSHLAHFDYVKLLLVGAGSKKVISEITPNYSVLSTATFHEMSALAERTKFFFVMRDPVSRTISGLKMGLQRGYIHPAQAQSLDDAVDALIAGTITYDLELSKYDGTIARLEKAVPKERIFYTFYEKMFQQREMDRFFSFLDVPSATINASQRLNVATKPNEQLSRDRLVALRVLLEPTYRFVLERFGDAVPSEWHRASEIPA